MRHIAASPRALRSCGFRSPSAASGWEGQQASDHATDSAGPPRPRGMPWTANERSARTPPAPFPESPSTVETPTGWRSRSRSLQASSATSAPNRYGTPRSPTPLMPACHYAMPRSSPVTPIHEPQSTGGRRPEQLARPVRVGTLECLVQRWSVSPRVGADLGRWVPENGAVIATS